MNQAEIGSAIIAKAMHFVNLYETKANAEWRNILNPSEGKAEGDELHAAMKACGWQDGWPYCAAFSEAIWKLAYAEAGAPQAVIDKFSKSMSPSVMASYAAFRQSITKVPVPGSIMFMQNGTGGTGHCGIVVASDGKNIATIEGNTSAGRAVSAEADRNGDGIFKKTRTLDFTVKASGLHLLGFLSPISW